MSTAEMPAAIRLYSIAVVPDPSCRNMMAFAHLTDSVMGRQCRRACCQCFKKIIPECASLETQAELSIGRAVVCGSQSRSTWCRSLAGGFTESKVEKSSIFEVPVFASGGAVDTCSMIFVRWEAVSAPLLRGAHLAALVVAIELTANAVRTVIRA